MKLKKRLTAVAEKVPLGAKIADIGTDHAYLPIYLIQNQLISSAIAVEIHRGPYMSAYETIDSFALGDKISLRFGNGLSVIRPGEVDTVVTAGMGAKTIIDILATYPDTTKTVKCLILQPMTASALLRRWLVQHGWYIADEVLVEEDRIYEIIVAKQGTTPKFDDIFYEIGPILWTKKDPMLKEHVKQLISSYRKIMLGLSLSAENCGTERYEQLKDKIERLETKLKCL